MAQTISTQKTDTPTTPWNPDDEAQAAELRGFAKSFLNGFCDVDFGSCLHDALLWVLSNDNREEHTMSYVRQIIQDKICDAQGAASIRREIPMGNDIENYPFCRDREREDTGWDYLMHGRQRLRYGSDGEVME